MNYQILDELTTVNEVIDLLLKHFQKAAHISEETRHAIMLALMDLRV